MTYDLDELQARDRYRILASLVVPRPIAWVSTVSPDGKLNTAPFSFFNVFGSAPPLVAFAPGNKSSEVPKDTARNIKLTQEFVIHLVDQPLGKAMAATAEPLPYGEDELDGLGLSLTPSEVVNVPRICEAPAALECREHSVIEIGQNRLILGVVHRVHTRDKILDADLKLIAPHHPIGRMASPSWYCETTTQFEL